MVKVEELLEALKKRDEDKNKNTVLWVLAISAQWPQLQVSHMQCTVTLHRITSRILKTTSRMTMTSTTS